MQPAAPLKLRLDKRAAAAPGVYEVACACGAVLRGPREANAQTVRCLACQSERFVLPRSPLPHVHDGELPTASGARRLRWPLIAAAAVVSVAVIGLTVLIYSLVRSPGRDKNPPPATAEERLAAHRDAGRAAFADGSFQRAATELKEALDAADQSPGKLGAA